MLALGVTNAWGEKITDYSKIGTGKTYYIGATTGGTDYYLSVSGASASTSTIAGTAVTDKTEAATFVFTGSGTSWTIKFADHANYLSLSSSKANGKVMVVSSAATFTASNQSGKLRLSIDSYSIQKNNSGTQFGSYGNTQTDIWLEEVPGSSEPTTQYTIKWHTAKGVTTDVTLNEGATITKPATDPAMTGYEFMGWTEDCAVASDGTGFTAISNFGTATEDKDYYAVFAVATTTSGEGSSNYEKVTSNLTDWAGDYLIAYNNTTFADGRIGGTGTGAMGASGVKVDLSSSISNNTIPASVGDQYNVTLEAVTGGYVLKTKDGKYNYQSSNNNGLTDTTNISTATTYAIKVTFTSENDIKLALSGGANGAVFRYNTSVYFLFYKNGGQSAVYLYKKVAGGSTTTYSDYITTCASDIEYVELGDAFKWSATEAEVTIDATDNVFPTLTNTHNVPVTYSSSDATIASIDANATVTLQKEGSVTITAKYEGGISAGTGKEYKSKTVTYSLKVNKAAPVASGTTYVKVTSTAGITDGEYLIVYETGKVAFNGALDALDVANNTLEVEINSNTIAGDQYIDKAIFTIDVTNGTILSASGYYIGKTASGNGLNTHKTTKYTNTITVDANQNAVVVSSGGPTLRYNKASDQKRFRYFGSGQEAIALYKKASEHIVTIATCTNGSVSASVTNGAKVLSGTTVTLENTPATGYKLTAYDVYKTGDATTKVTVTDGKFIMPEFDVTISATFELAKTLTGIEITTPATQTTFWQGETFNSTGLKVTAHFDGASDEDVTDKVTVTGSTATAGAAVEVTVSFTEGTTTKTTTYTINVKAIPNTKETAYTVADAYDIIDKLTTAEGVFISGIISQVDSYNSTYKSITYWISADGTTTKQLQVYSGKGLKSADFSGKTDLSIGDQVIVCGNLKKYDGTYEFDKNNYLAEYTKTTKANPELSYTTTEYNVNLGDAFTAPTLNNPNTLAVTYSSNNEDVATVAADGAVTIKAAGTVVITASFAGNDDYVAGEASYTINITDPNVSEATFVAGTDKSDTKSISKKGITVEFADGSFSRDDNYRCYAGKSMTISYADGNITKIVIECTANDEAEYGPGQFTTETATYSYSGKVGTWIGEAKSVTFTNIKQVRMTTITVYYKKDNRQETGIAWNPETINLTVGDAFTAPTFNNPNGLSGITFASSNEALATVNNAGAITLVSGKTGTATITATFADGHATYKPAEATCVITVSPKSEKVVILAEYNGQWYALKAAYLSGKTDRLDAVPVNYVGGKLYNVAETDKEAIEWNSIVEGTKVSFLHDGKYLKGKTSTTLLFEAGEDGLYQWDNTNYTMTIGTTVRSFLYNGEAFRNFAVSNAGKVVNDVLYSSLPVVTAPVYATGDAYGRTVTTGEYGTICIPYGSSNYTGAEFYEISWMEMDGTTPKGIWLDQVNGALTAGKPYIFKATADEIAIVGDGTTAAAPVVGVAGLTGTFTLIQDSETSGDALNKLEGNYMIAGNQFLLCGTGCWLKENRAYIDASIIANHTTKKAVIPGRRRVCLGETSENTTTGVDNNQLPNANIQKVIENGQFIIIRDGVKYNVQGQVIR